MMIIAPGLHSFFLTGLYVSESIRESHCTWLISSTRASSDNRSHHALRWNGCLVKSHEGLETKVGLKPDLVGGWLVLTTRFGTCPITLLWVPNSVRGARLLQGMIF
ncbi:hypothetical protein M9H77_27549 [Catharanthus roseus]|uniref:Uncharacterized protein n=1 Tax=Catharanthus roseus TaxID=4058 RepID=A0ACC0AGY9_CATRO|nr:hypothetical protein M9H77_27549 [Catharanthus roseus]